MSILCSVGVSVVLRLHSDAVLEIEGLKSSQFSRWPGTATALTSKLVGVQHKKKKQKHLRDVNVSQTNRTRTVTAILESAMNKEEGQEERLSEHQFS